MKLSKNEKIILAAAGIGVAAGVAAYFIYREMKKRGGNDECFYLSAPQTNEELENVVENDKEVDFNCAASTTLSYEDAYQIAVNIATKQFGENPLVVSASEKKAMYVNVGGIMRPCYMFGADKPGLYEGVMHGIYHVDADTGEVFDNSNGMMKKID